MLCLTCLARQAKSNDPQELVAQRVFHGNNYQHRHEKTGRNNRAQHWKFIQHAHLNLSIFFEERNMRK